jgi:cation diffusion facilitator CzcD-associated flavoprotein CzcO
VVGGGQAGLGIGGRLQALNVSYLVVDKFGTVGDSWDSRYDSTKRELARSSTAAVPLLTVKQSIQFENMACNYGVLAKKAILINCAGRTFALLPDIRQLVSRVFDQGGYRQRSQGLCQEIRHRRPSHDYQTPWRDC